MKLKQIIMIAVEKRVKQMAVYNNVMRSLVASRTKCGRMEKENRELAERVGVISDKMCNVTAQRHSDPLRRIRIIVEIDPDIADHLLMHGNDSTFIEYIGRHIGELAADAIQKANYSRWEV